MVRVKARAVAKVKVRAMARVRAIDRAVARVKAMTRAIQSYNAHDVTLGFLKHFCGMGKQFLLEQD